MLKIVLKLYSINPILTITRCYNCDSFISNAKNVKMCLNPTLNMHSLTTGRYFDYELNLYIHQTILVSVGMETSEIVLVEKTAINLAYPIYSYRTFNYYINRLGKFKFIVITNRGRMNILIEDENGRFCFQCLGLVL